MRAVEPQQRYNQSPKGRRRRKRYEKKPKGCYIRHRQNARTRGIGFTLTFEEWWAIWDVSGHWEKRGNRKNRYQMCRIRDSGPYAVGNVFIAKMLENVYDRNRNYKPGSSERQAEASVP